MTKEECLVCGKWCEDKDIKQCVDCLTVCCLECSVEWCEHDYCYTNCGNRICKDCYEKEKEIRREREERKKREKEIEEKEKEEDMKRNRYIYEKLSKLERDIEYLKASMTYYNYNSK